MALLDALGGVAGSLIDYFSQAGTNAANALMTQSTNSANQQINRENNAQNWAITQQAWARDDNAIQRRVADLKAAGLSPILAAGSAAGVSAPIRMQAITNQAPQLGAAPTVQDKVVNVMALMRAKSEISQSSAEAYLKQREAQITQMVQDELKGQFEGPMGEALRRKEIMLSQYSQALADARTAQATAEAARYNLDWYKSRGLPTDVDEDTKSKLAKGQILGLDNKQSVLLGGLYDTAAKMIPRVAPLKAQ